MSSDFRLFWFWLVFTEELGHLVEIGQLQNTYNQQSDGTAEDGNQSENRNKHSFVSTAFCSSLRTDESDAGCSTTNGHG